MFERDHRMLMRFLLSRYAAGLLLAGVVFCGGGVVFATVWDQNCKQAISSLQDTQQSIQLLRGEQIVHEMHRGSSSFLVEIEGDWSEPQISQSEHQYREHKMRDLLERFNGSLKKFSESCLNDHSEY